MQYSLHCIKSADHFLQTRLKLSRYCANSKYEPWYDVCLLDWTPETDDSFRIYQCDFAVFTVNFSLFHGTNCISKGKQLSFISSPTCTCILSTDYQSVWKLSFLRHPSSERAIVSVIICSVVTPCCFSLQNSPHSISFPNAFILCRKWCSVSRPKDHLCSFEINSLDNLRRPKLSSVTQGFNVLM